MSTRSFIVYSALTMEGKILETEERYHRLNAELEAKTTELMKQVVAVMKIQEQPVDEMAPLPPPPPKAKVPKSQDVGEEEGGVGVGRFLEAKLRQLRAELDALRGDFTTKAEECRRIEAQLKSSAEERSKLRGQLDSLRERLSRQEQVAAVAASRLRERDREVAELRKEADALRSQLRQASQSAASAETRTNRLQDAATKQREDLQRAKAEMATAKDEAGRRCDAQAAAVRRLQRQKADMARVFRKQMALVDNLRRQRDHILGARYLRFAEEEFAKLLDWTPDLHPRRLNVA